MPWKVEGLRSRGLDYLLYRFGYFFDGHRAMNDCQAVLHLLSLTLPTSGQPILPVFLENARRRAWRIWALEADFDLKDRLKARGYRWSNGEDGRPKACSGTSTTPSSPRRKSSSPSRSMPANRGTR